MPSDPKSLDVKEFGRIASLPPGPGCSKDDEPLNMIGSSATTPTLSPEGPTSSPGSDFNGERFLTLSSKLGTVSYVLQRQNPAVSSIFHGRLVTNNTPNSIAVCCRHEPSEVCGLYPTVQHFILAVRASAHPANATQDSRDPATLEPFAIGERPGYACPASLDADSSPVLHNDDLINAPAATPPPPPFAPSLSGGSAFAAFPPRADLSSASAQPARRLPPALEASLDAEEVPGSPERGVSPRLAARLEG